jgi:2-iminoacetate synthase
MDNIKQIIDEDKIFNILEKNRNPVSVQKILEKAEEKKGLNLEEVGCLVNAENPELINKMFETAGKIKREIYGERLVLFAPLYASSFCVNDCEYCGFHRRNPALRKKLTLDEVAEQAKILEEMGHKRLLLESGEHPLENPIDYIVDVIKKIYETKSGTRLCQGFGGQGGEIRRVNVNIAATTVEDYRKLKAAGIGTYQLFQETYHRKTYEKLHCGPKADFERQLFAHDRAFEAGIDDVGLGVLFGLYDWKFEVLALVSHAQYLDRKFGVGPHTFSVPRFQPAETVDMELPYAISESDLLRIIAILRLAVPYTGMIISTRERPAIRAKAFEIGVSQTSAASCVKIGGYSQKFKFQIPNPKQIQNSKFKIQNSDSNTGQFTLNDERTLDEVVGGILEQKLLPSFCTACYRSGRTGKTFMDLAKPGNIHNFCRPNAILTFQEYLEDYASYGVKNSGEKIINKYLSEIPNEKIRQQTQEKLKKIKKGERDLYF